MNTPQKPIKKTFLAGKWMPSDQETLNAWMKKTMDKEAASTRPLSPTLENFKNFIESNPKAYMFFTQMFNQVPANETKSPSGLPQVRDYNHMLRLFNVMMTHAPEYNDTGLVGCPFNAVLDCPGQQLAAGQLF